ncbi:MAG: hypothetical protein AUH36_03840 [Chloroflexi bacterium 13_1_40CM_55_7]|nr:MAG: hypothetical protein AUH36_03840 [Chloroflexi bacterium 13_1_40CM_55_7]
MLRRGCKRPPGNCAAVSLETGETPAFDELKQDHKMAGAALVYAHSKTAALVISGASRRYA